MSISILKTTQQLEPTYNPMIIVATSSNQTQDQFLMIGDIYVNGVYTTRMKVAPNPEGDCIFDIHKHVENRISYDFNPNHYYVNLATQSQATYSVLLGEEWLPFFNFIDNAFLTGGLVGFLGGSGSNPQPQFQIGQQILITQTAPFTFSQYNGITTITNITATGSSWIIHTNKPYLGPTPLNPGVITLANQQTYIGANLANVGNTSSLTGQKWAFNGVRNFLDDINWNASEYTAGTYSGGTSSFLTNAPQNWILATYSRMWLHAFQNDGNDITKIKIQSQNGLFEFNNSFTSPTLYNKQPLLEIACGPYQLINNTTNITTLSGALPIIDNSTKQYTVWCENASGQITIYPHTFNLEKYCSRYEKVQLVFMDKLGSMIPFIFNFANRENLNITRSNYQQFYGQYPSKNQTWNYNSWDRGKKSLDTQVVNSYTITSDWINQSQSDYLMTLMESPEVYWIKEDGTTLAVSLTVNSVERKQTINDMIINYTITFELSNKNMMQRG